MKKRHPTCAECNTQGVRSEKYDAYYCKRCNVWLEPRCSLCACPYCETRPDKPLRQLTVTLP